jgi:predicted enzyme related to lactoylglutathione lyase
VAVLFKTPPRSSGSIPGWRDCAGAGRALRIYPMWRNDMATKKSENDRRIDYVELNVADVARSKRFYGEAFGWSFKDYGPDYCEFQDGRLTGGFAAGKARGAGGPLVIIYADDLADVERRVEAAGGRIVKPAYDFPGGRRFHFTDPDGYELAAWSAR